MSNFTGIWIPNEIIDLNLSPVDMLILSMIFTMQPFYASNRYISEKLNVTKRTVSGRIADLEKKGLISISGATSSRVITIENIAIADPNCGKNCYSTIEDISSTMEDISPTMENFSTYNKYRKDKKEDIKDTQKKHPDFEVPVNHTRYNNLVIDFGKTAVDRYIQKAIDYISSSGKKPYNDYAAAAANYLHRDNVEKIPQITTEELPEFLKGEYKNEF